MIKNILRFAKDNKAVLAASLLLTFFCADALAAQSIGDVASTITSSFSNVTKLITGASYIAGLAFAIGAILKFKQHKDNPTNIPIGTPIALLFIAAALLFMPTILNVTGVTMFGSSGGSVAGPSGIIFTTS